VVDEITGEYRSWHTEAVHATLAESGAASLSITHNAKQAVEQQQQKENAAPKK